jgi:hypothetical protein
MDVEVRRHSAVIACQRATSTCHAGLFLRLPSTQGPTTKGDVLMHHREVGKLEQLQVPILKEIVYRSMFRAAQAILDRPLYPGEL